MTTDTTAPSYWLNWRFLLCAICVVISMVFASLAIWKYEGSNKYKSRTMGDRREAVGCSLKDESWGTCLKSIHPIWLLAYRIVAFSSMLALLLADVIIHSGGIFYFYTQWTFTLVTVYFGLASSLSFRGCLQFCYKFDSERSCRVDKAERGSYVAPTVEEDADVPRLNHYNEPSCQTSSVWEYALQIIFQLDACVHSVNAGFLLGDTVLNSLWFPLFRIAYFVLWTCVFVIFQWILHVFVSTGWPYPFLDLSSPYAPLWYLSIGLLHFPCFGIFTLVYRIKGCYLSR